MVHGRTCVGVRRMMLARCSRSGADRYRCCRNLRSSSYVCAFENKTLLLRFFVLLGCAGVWPPDSCCPSDSGSSSSVSSSWSSPSCPMSGALIIADESVLDESGPGPLEGLFRRGGKLSRETELEWRSGSCSGPPLVGSGGARELGEVLSGLTCCCWGPETWRSVQIRFFAFHYPWLQASAEVLMRSALFWDMPQRRVVILYRRFGKTYRCHLQGPRIPRFLDPWRWDHYVVPKRR
jgi:hypothetical protein